MYISIFKKFTYTFTLLIINQELILTLPYEIVPPTCFYLMLSSF